MSLNKSFNPRAIFPYPDITDQHYLKVLKNDGTIFDKDYPYIDNSRSFRFKRWWVRFLLYTIVFPFSYVRMGLKIRGKKNIRRNKKLLKHGALSISNHINMWDYIAVMNAIKPFRPYLLAWQKNVSGESGPLVRLVGGIPIPEHDPQATIAYIDTIKNLLDSGGWLHIYPEGSMWEYYRYIRPFKKGIAHIARMSHKPIIPMAFSFRKAGWIRRKIFHQPAKINLCIGEPIFINEDLTPQKQEIDLLNRCHKAIEDLAGFFEGENPYEAIFNGDKRIDF